MHKSVEPYRPEGYEPLTFHDRIHSFLSREDNPRAYLERCLATIEEVEPKVQAFVVINVEGARKAADLSTERYRTGRPLSPVDGMPVGIKDLYETADMPTQMGSPLYKDWQSGRDCASVYALRQGGAVILGKTVTTELGFYSPGPTRNPFDITRTPGGSSSGSAAAVGARMIPAAIGSQVVGSLIRPAGYCANVGFKPSFGALNRAGGGTGLSQAVIGVHAGGLEDSWRVSQQISRVVGGDHGHPGLDAEAKRPSPEKPASVMVLETAGWSICNEETREQLLSAVDVLAKEGVCIVTKVNNADAAKFSEAIQGAREITHDICGYELRWPLKMYRERGPNALSSDITKRLEVWETLTPSRYHDALVERETLRRDYEKLKTIASATITLSATGAAPVGQGTGDPVFAVPTSLLGTPAINLPILTTENMPLGLQLIGYYRMDLQLFAHAAWIEQSILRAKGKL